MNAADLGKQKARPTAVPFPPAVTRLSAVPAAASDVSLAPPFRTDKVSVPPPRTRLGRSEVAWDDMPDEGVVEAMFEEDVSRATDGMQRDSPEFPIDAFIIPKHPSWVPQGLDEAQIEAVKHHTEELDTDAKENLADCFEKLSRRIRNENTSTLLAQLARGDRFDTLVAPIIAELLTPENG